MIKYLYQRSISSYPDKKLLIDFLFKKYFLTKEKDILISIIENLNIKLYLEFYNCCEGLFIEELVFRSQLNLNNDIFFLNDLEKYLYDNYHFYYLMIKTEDKRVIFSSEVIRIKTNNFELYPSIIEFNIINSINDNIFKWKPTKIQLEKILNINEDKFFDEEFYNQLSDNIIENLIVSFCYYILIFFSFLIFILMFYL